MREVQEPAMPPRTIIGGHFAAQLAAKTDFQVVQKWTLMHDLFSPRGSTIQGGIDRTAKDAKKSQLEDLETRTDSTTRFFKILPSSGSNGVRGDGREQPGLQPGLLPRHNHANCR